MHRNHDNDRLATITGVIVPADWDRHGNITGVSISGFDEQEYLVQKQVKGAELIQHVRRDAEIVGWVEVECNALRQHGELAADMPPNLFPYVRENDPDWLPRYARFNNPGTYHNGGIWPFICAFYIGAIVAAGFQRLAERKLGVLTQLIRSARKAKVAYGFNEWLKAQDGTPQGQDWQTWSAAMYLYAAACVERKTTPFFDIIRESTE